MDAKRIVPLKLSGPVMRGGLNLEKRIMNWILGAQVEIPKNRPPLRPHCYHCKAELPNHEDHCKHKGI